MATEVWSEHLADINRALQVVSTAAKELAREIPPGQPGHWSELGFEIGPVAVLLGGEKTGWSLQFSEDVEAWVAVFGEAGR